ncbi:MAG TPA: hypothetical protein ENI23_05935 [bacterium]|nr:hypothetical protein [bacterium]
MRVYLRESDLVTIDSLIYVFGEELDRFITEREPFLVEWSRDGAHFAVPWGPDHWITQRGYNAPSGGMPITNEEMIKELVDNFREGTDYEDDVDNPKDQGWYRVISLGEGHKMYREEVYDFINGDGSLTPDKHLEARNEFLHVLGELVYSEEFANRVDSEGLDPEFDDIGGGITGPFLSYEGFGLFIEKELYISSKGITIDGKLGTSLPPSEESIGDWVIDLMKSELG